MTIILFFPFDPSGSLLPVKADSGSNQPSYKGKNPRVEHYDAIVLLTDGEVPVLPPGLLDLLTPIIIGGTTVVDMEIIKKILDSLGETK